MVFSVGEPPYDAEVGLRRRWARALAEAAGRNWPLEMRLIADVILMASSLFAFQLSLLSDKGLLEMPPLEVRTGIRDGRSVGGRFKKLLFSMFRRGEASLSDRGMLVEGGAGIGELLFFFDKNPALNLLFLGTFRVDSEDAGSGEAPKEGLRFLVGTGIPRGIGDVRCTGRSLPGLASDTAGGGARFPCFCGVL